MKALFSEQELFFKFSNFSKFKIFLIFAIPHFKWKKNIFQK